MIRILVLAAVALATVGASCGSAATSAAGPCKASQLSGTFKAIPGSEGAGNIVYALVVKNRSTTTCTLTGLPHGKLLNANGKAQPTHVIAANKGALTAVLVHLTPGHTSRATARFSPDVPGVGEGAAGKQCEPTSYGFRVSAPGGGTFTVKLSPATPVCEHGQLQFTAYGGNG